MFFCLSVLLFGCEPGAKVVETHNEFGGPTRVEKTLSRARLKQRKSYFDDHGVKRKEERTPIDKAAKNLGFSFQVVTYDETGAITTDLRTAPEVLDNQFGYLSFKRIYGARRKLLSGEVQFKKAKADQQGYTFSRILYNPKGRPERVFYYDQNHKLIFAAPAKQVYKRP